MKRKEKTVYDNLISFDHSSKVFRGTTSDVVVPPTLHNSKKFLASILLHGSANHIKIIYI